MENNISMRIWQGGHSGVTEDDPIFAQHNFQLQSSPYI